MRDAGCEMHTIVDIFHYCSIVSFHFCHFYVESSCVEQLIEKWAAAIIILKSEPGIEFHATTYNSYDIPKLIKQSNKFKENVTEAISPNIIHLICFSA